MAHWEHLGEASDWDKLANDTAYNLATRGWTGTVSTDFGHLVLHNRMQDGDVVVRSAERRPELQLSTNSDVAVYQKNRLCV